MTTFDRVVGPWERGFYHASSAKQAELGPISEAEIASRQAAMEEIAATSGRLSRNAGGFGGPQPKQMIFEGISPCITTVPVFITNIVSTCTNDQGWTVTFDIRGGTKWIGTDGWVWVDRGGHDASNVDWFAEIPADKYKVKLYKSENHQRNFIECAKSRQATITPIEVAHHSAIPGHLGLISMLLGRKIKWDATKEVIVGDAEASKLLTRPYREPWKLA